MVKYVTKESLLDVPTSEWVKRGNQRQVRNIIVHLAPGLKYPVLRSMYHESRLDSIRMFVGLSDGGQFTMDVPVEWFNNLPSVEV